MLKKTLILLILSAQIALNAQLFQDIALNIGITSGYGVGFGGGGISFCDFNGDGLDDLTLATSSGTLVRFFENNGTTLVEIASLVSNLDEVKQVVWADYDNDGDKDLFIAAYNGFNRLYQNDGQMNMTDVTIASGIPSINTLNFGACFADYDNDGWLDLYISVRFGGGSTTNLLLRNNQNGTFSDLTSTLMVGNGNTLSHGASFFDYDNNLTPDLYLIEDKNNPNVLFQNINGVFTDVSVPTNAGVVIDAMNEGIGDYDNDGDLDIYITSTPPGTSSSTISYHGNVLLQNNNGVFTDVAPAAGVKMDRWSWGGNWLDYDNDMDLDLYVCTYEDSLHTPNALYENLSTGVFTEHNLLNDTTRTYGNAIGDFNEDGLMDVVVCAGYGYPFVIWENVNPTTNNWIKVNLEGVQSNRDGIGAWIEVKTGTDIQYRYTICGEAFLAQNSMNHHIGLGTNTIIDEIKIRWPSGKEDVLMDVAVNQKINIKEGDYAPGTCENNILIPSVTVDSTYNAAVSISSDAVIPTSFMIQFEAGDCIELQTGFEVELGAEFSAEISLCQ